MTMHRAERPALVLPNLVIAGVSKAGTTSLFNYLGQHPDICRSDLKELRYFTPIRLGRQLGPLEEYASHFNHCDGQKYRLEATPNYYYGGAALARALHETCPDARVLISFRSPPERCWSLFNFWKSRLRIPKDMTFDAYLDRCEELHRAGAGAGARGGAEPENHAFEPENQAFGGLSGGCYSNWLEAWHAEFKDSLSVVDFDDIVAQPVSLIKDICRWLVLEEDVVDGFRFLVENKTEQYRRKGLQKVALSVNRRGGRFFGDHPSIKRRLRRAYYVVNRQHSRGAVPPSARSRMDEFFRPFNLELSRQFAAFQLPAPRWLAMTDNAR